jgi:hypothetical protein
VIAGLVRLALLRLARGKRLGVAILVAAAPLPFAWWLRDRAGAHDQAFGVSRLLLAVVPPWLVAGALGEELEHATYLWSRPLPRWTILAGELVAFGPVAAVLVCASWLACGALATGALPQLASIAALGAGTLVVACACTGIAVLVPRHAIALSVAYIMFDLFTGQLPASLHELSITSHVQHLATGWSTVDALALLAIAAAWTAIGLVRVRSREA